MDGEQLDVEPGFFDAVISRVGFIYFPDQQAAFAGMRRALRPGGRLAGVVYSIRRVSAPLRMASAAECVRFERDSFGALHQMMAALTEQERDDAWSEIEQGLSQFQTAQGFEAPCELLVSTGSAAEPPATSW